MPPKKRTSTGTSDSGQNKRQRTSNDQQPEEGQNGPSDASDQQFGYYCIPVPYSEFKAQCQDAENGDDEDEGDEDEDDEEEGPKGSARAAYEKQFKNDILLKPAAETPDHKWIATWATWKFIADYKHRADFVDPDNFAMHIYTDFAGYGMQELVENMILAFDKHFKKKDRGEETVKLMWSTAAAVGHLFWLLDLGPWMGCDDSERVNTTIGVIGNMALTALNELDRAGLLKADSPIQDIGLVIGIFAIWAKNLEVDYEFEGASWVKDIVAYAARADIDLRQMPLHSIGKVLDGLAEENEEPLAALDGPAKADRWGWKKSLKELGPQIGGRHYDITQMSRKQRIQYSLDGVDPLAEFSEKDIKAGNVALA